MKFLIHVNASGALASWLIAQSHDVAKVADKNPKMSDEEILMWALSEDRIIVTTDKDFGNSLALFKINRSVQANGDVF